MSEEKKHNEHITTYLDWYLDIENPEFAVMIKGEWGSGKSYFIKKYIESKKDEKFIFISLNGLSTTKEIDQQILSSVHPIFKNRLIGPVLRIGGNALAEKAGFSDTVASFDSKTLVNFDKEKYIFIFDDFERHCFEKPHTLMGYINSFIEEKHRHVIILSNEEIVINHSDDKSNEDSRKLDKDEQSYEYIKEKVIGQTLTIDTPLEHVYKCLLSEMAKDGKLKAAIKIIQNKDDLVFDTIRKSGYRNFRVLRQTIQNFGRLYDLIDNKYFENHKFIELLLPIFFALEIESRIGELCKDVFKEIEHGGYLIINDKKLTMNQQKASDLLNKYNLHTFFNTWVFDLDIWRKWLFEGNVDKSLINDNLSKSYLFKNETCISKMIDWTDLPDDEFDEAIKEIIQKIKGEELTNPSEIFLVYNRFLDFEEHDFDFSSYFTDNINKIFTEYLSSINKNDKLEEDYSFLHQGFEPKGNIEEYKKFKSDLIDAIRQKTINIDKHRAKTFLEVMKNDSKKAGDMIYEIVDEKTKQPKRLFEFIDPKEFVNCYNNLENKNKRIICYKIEDRFKFIQNKDWLLDEKVFIEKSIEYIQEIIEKEVYSPSIFNLEQLKIAFKNSIEVISEYEKNK
jgi:hypothetical protein